MARRPHTGPSGFAVVDKPAGWTSHDVVAKCRGILGTRKIGHSGTLDPDATGVLVLGVGSGTRLLRFLDAADKRYSATIRFGVETSTLDAAGDVTATHDMSALTAAAVHAAVERFRGDIMQVPPMVSAIKIDGRRLHELAREGIEVDRPARPVTVHRFELVETDDPLVWEADVCCSAGTYIRSLAADLGRALGGGAHLVRLRRTEVGRFTLEMATLLEQVAVMPLAAAAPPARVVRLGESDVAAVRQGKFLERAVVLSSATDAVDGAGQWWAVDEAGDVVAVLEPSRHAGLLKPAVVVA